MDSAQTAPTPVDGRQKRRLVPVVDARFQWKYTLLITSLGVGTTAIMGAFLYSKYVEATRLLELSERFRGEVARSDQIFLFYLIILVVLMALALTVGGIIVTHRISGPLFLVARHLDTIAGGRYPDLRPLRKRDELHEFFAAFEAAVDAMKQRDATWAMEIKKALDSGDAEALKALAGRMQNELETRIAP
ncbi:MAG: hypothetical protein AAF658_17845 [Myxococcota bacterium]